MQVHTGVGQWMDFLEKGIDTATGILTERYGQPPAGTYIQTNPDGSTTIIRATEGGTLPVLAGEAKVTADIFPPTMLPLLVGGAMFLVVMVVMSRGKKGGGGDRYY